MRKQSFLLVAATLLFATLPSFAGVTRFSVHHVFKPAARGIVHVGRTTGHATKRVLF